MQFIPNTNLLTNLGWALLNSFWQMAVLWLLYMLLTFPSKRFSAVAKHNLAFILMGLGTAWFLSGFFRKNAIPSFLTYSGTGVLYKLQHLSVYVTQALPYLSFIYLSAILFLCCRQLFYYRRIQKVYQGGISGFPSLELFTADMALYIGIKRKVHLFLSSVIHVPQTTGFIKPIILFPLALINQLSMEQVESILVHELMHIRRNDYLTNIFVSLVKTIFFFNPFARLFIRTIKREREHACDDEVMSYNYPAYSYATALLTLEKTRQETASLSLAANGKNDKLLLERVKRVTGHLQRPRRSIHPLLVCSLFIGLFPFNSAGPATKENTPVMQAPGSSYAFIVLTKFSPAITPVTVETNFVEWKTSRHKEKTIKRMTFRNIDPPAIAIGPAAPDSNPYLVQYTDEPDNRNFSNESFVIQQVPEDVSISAGSAPYVPSSSFSYQCMADTLKPADRETQLMEQKLKEALVEDMHADEAREKIEEALSQRLFELKQLEAQKQQMLRKAQLNNKVILNQTREMLNKRKIEIQHSLEKLQKMSAEGIIYI